MKPAELEKIKETRESLLVFLDGVFIDGFLRLDEPGWGSSGMEFDGSDPEHLQKLYERIESFYATRTPLYIRGQEKEEK